MAKLQSLRELLVWQKSIDLPVRCHRIAKRFPRDEQPARLPDAQVVAVDSIEYRGRIRETLDSFVHPTPVDSTRLWRGAANTIDCVRQIKTGR